jgi:hypothetical protein
VGLTRIQATLDLLGQVEAAQQVLVLVCLQSRLLMAAMEGGQLCITELIMAAAVAVPLVLLVHTEVQPKGVEEVKHRQ